MIDENELTGMKEEIVTSGLTIDQPMPCNTITTQDLENDVQPEISVADNRVVVKLSEGVTMDEAATLFFNNLNTLLPDWMAAAGYVRKGKCNE